MGKIYELPDALADKIAAGEVVERPASVVKELLENAIDANSHSIKVEIEEAGLRSIKVIDDGEGIDSEDVMKAFNRHATSKIKDEAQLFRIQTLGFRGEALASIASVSQLTLRTSTGLEAGTEVHIHGGNVKEKNVTTKRKGTEIIVEHLFYNTPARLKYLKTVHTELGHITDVINRMALAHPEVRFECTHNGKKLFLSPGNDQLLQVIQQVYGAKIVQDMLKIENSSLDYRITGFIAKPENARSNRNYISLLVNGRYIKNPVINKAIMEGFHTFLPIGRYPIAVIHMEMDPYLVDVNVHPAKTEVRFSKEKELYQIVKDTVYKALHQETLIPEGRKKHKDTSEQTTFDFSSTNHVQETQAPLSGNFDTPKRVFTEQPATTPSSDSINESSNKEDSSFTNEGELLGKNTKEDTPTERMPVVYPIGQLRGTYILAQNEEGFYMIDQHAAQERIKYEFYKDKLGNPEHELQELLVPLTFDFSQNESIMIETKKAELEAVGLILEGFGDRSYIVRAHPSWFPTGEEEQIIRDMVEDLVTDRAINIEKLREEAAILLSCKRSIKANHYLNHAEMEYLLQELRACVDPFTCPHGRPIVVHFSDYEIQRMFKRIM
ncbi:DNA mismatch repair endonuclease MutL [Halalkalibacillus halophilus]|uniref:DNA mismatch repair endonuclease MutL n=1 Tax=Halalkalibacillus halophilus TaxID=392827 RepID=UPI0004090264|nr:DNA mismatch repair endonuclease MutL [Halalkalibacillus halophilus]